eukprot:Skav233526  [mRNA]  locus=scaffold2975:268787:271531:- [translate_table: standard]
MASPEGEDGVLPSLDGLAKVWEEDSVVRTLLLHNGSLLSWPSEKMKGVVTFETMRPNARVIKHDPIVREIFELVSEYWSVMSRRSSTDSVSTDGNERLAIEGNEEKGVDPGDDSDVLIEDVIALAQPVEPPHDSQLLDDTLLPPSPDKEMDTEIKDAEPVFLEPEYDPDVYGEAHTDTPAPEDSAQQQHGELPENNLSNGNDIPSVASPSCAPTELDSSPSPPAEHTSENHAKHVIEIDDSPQPSKKVSLEQIRARINQLKILDCIVLQKLEAKSCPRPLQSTSAPADPPRACGDNVETLPLDLSPVAKAWQDDGGPKDIPLGDGGGKLRRANAAGEDDAGPSGDVAIGATLHPDPVGSSHSSLFHANEMVERTEQMEARNQMMKNKKEKETEGDQEGEDEDEDEEQPKKSKAKAAAKAKAKCKAKSKAKAKAKGKAKCKAKSKAKAKAKAKAKTQALAEGAAEETKADAATEMHTVQESNTGEEPAQLPQVKQHVSKRKAQAEEKKKEKEQARKAAADAKQKEKEEAKEAKRKAKEDAKIARKAQKEKAKEGAKKPRSAGKQEKVPEHAADEAPTKEEKKTFARRSRPFSKEGMRRWDSLKMTFNTRVAPMFARPASLEVWGGLKNIGCTKVCGFNWTCSKKNTLHPSVLSIWILSPWLPCKEPFWDYCIEQLQNQSSSAPITNLDFFFAGCVASFFMDDDVKSNLSHLLP